MKGDLRKAAKMYGRRRYPPVIRLLEPQIFRFRQNYDFFYLVGMSCLHTGDLGGASTYLQRGLGLKPHDTKANLGLALVHLKRLDVQEAIRCYLEIIDYEPNNRYAKRALALLQRDSSPDQLAHLSESGRLNRLLPDRKLNWTPFIVAVLILAVAGSAPVLLLRYTTFFEREQTPRDSAVERMILDDIGEIVDLGGDYRYILTERQIERVFSDMKKHFAKFRDNLAQKDINLLLGSNAALKVKEQARTISSYITKPDFTTMRDPFAYQDVVDDPFRYNRTYVVWRGKLSNLSITNERIAFDLLVGYETNETLFGVVPVVLDFAALLSQGDPVEVLGQVTLTETGDLFLQGISIHKLLPERGN